MQSPIFSSGSARALAGALAISLAVTAGYASPKPASRSAAARPAAHGRGASKSAGAAPRAAVMAKPLSPGVSRGLSWLAQTQLKNGGWGQGDESVEMGRGAQMRDVASVADTCAASLALLRSGSASASGPYAKNIRSGVDFVCREIESSDKSSLYITKLRNTRLQMKLGQFIDTFMASLLLAEVKGKMGSEAAEKRVAACFHKVGDKIDRNQSKDGTWEKDGWAPALSQAMASKAMNRAVGKGLRVSEVTRQRTEDFGRAQFSKAPNGAAGGGSFKVDKSAGVALYGAASSLGSMQDSDNANRLKEKDARENLKKARSAPARARAQQQLDRIAANRRDLQHAQEAIVSKMDDKTFLSGFGSNGGEEFLSYMNIGESLVTRGGSEWTKWDRSMTANLNRIQNQDGTWSGHHCITGRTFCTSAALLCLMVDRAPVPVASRMARR